MRRIRVSNKRSFLCKDVRTSQCSNFSCSLFGNTNDFKLECDNFGHLEDFLQLVFHVSVFLEDTVYDLPVRREDNKMIHQD